MPAKLFFKFFSARVNDNFLFLHISNINLITKEKLKRGKF